MPGLAGEVANLIVALKLDDSGFSGKLNRAAGQLRAMDAGLSQVGRGVGQVSGGLLRLGERAALAAGAGLAGVVATAASYEQAFTGVEKTVDASIEQFTELERAIKQMAGTTGTSFEELARIGEIGGALGVDVSELETFIDVVNRLAVSTDLSVDTASTALGQLRTVLDLSDSELRGLADSLVALGNAGASTEPQIVDLAARFAIAGDRAGLSTEEILALSSAVTSMGVEVEAGGTALSKTFNDIAVAIGTGADEVEGFTSLLGISAGEFRRRWEEDALGVFQEWLKELSALDPIAQAVQLEMAGITGSRQQAAIGAIAANWQFVGEQLTIAKDATGALQEESDKFFGTSAQSFAKLRENVRNAADTIGSALLPVTNDLIADFTEFLNQPDTQAGLKSFATDLAEGVRGLANELRGTDFSGIIGGIKIAAQVAKTAFDAFRSLPEPIQQLAVAAFAANKLSGGAIGQIAAGMGNILLGSLKTITASHVTVVGGTVTGGPGLGGGGGGLLGRIGGGLAVAGGAAAAGFAVNEAVQFDAQRDQWVADLNRTLDNLPRETGAEIDRSISRIESVISQERPLLEGILFNTNIKPSLDQELAELRALQQAAARSEAAARDAIPWAQRNADAAARAIQIQSQVLAVTQGSKSEIARLANIPHNVNVDNHVNVGVNVGVSVLNQYVYRQRVATGFSESTLSGGI